MTFRLGQGDSLGSLHPVSEVELLLEEAAGTGELLGLPEGCPASHGCWGGGVLVLQPPSPVAGAVGVWHFHSRENPETPELRAGAVFGQDLLLPATGVRGCSSQLGNALCACGWERTAGK